MKKKMSDGFIIFLKQLITEKKFKQLFETINDTFLDDINNEEFLKWMSKKLGMKRLGELSQ